jgi:RNA polymerase sigma-70 factor, ECF subfamily
MDLHELWRRGREACPEVELAEARFAELAGAAVAKATGEEPGPVAAGELYLACACADGVEAAGRVLSRDYLTAVKRRLGRMGLAPADIDEVAQRVCERLLESGPDGGGARLIHYALQGRLRSLMVVTATHIAVDSFRRTGREKGDQEALLELAGAPDPRSELMRRQGQAVFKSAMESGLEALDARTRNVLRLHLIDRLSLEEIADYYQVHRVTVSRWLAAARGSIVERARTVARVEFGVSEAEFDAAYTGSELGLSLERVLS